MSGAADTSNPAAPGEEQRWRRSWAWIVGTLGIVLGGVLTFIFVAHRSPLMPEEARLVGRWYGILFEQDDRTCGVLIEDYDRDRTLTLTIRKFEREGADISAPWKPVPVTESEHMRGRWRLTSGTIEWAITDSLRRKSLWRRLVTLVREQRWEREGPEIVTFDPVNVTPVAKHFALRTLSRDFHSLRVPEDFELPDQPLAPDVALAWWAETSGRALEPANESTSP